MYTKREHKSQEIILLPGTHRVLNLYTRRSYSCQGTTGYWICASGHSKSRLTCVDKSHKVCDVSRWQQVLSYWTYIFAWKEAELKVSIYPEVPSTIHFFRIGWKSFEASIMRHFLPNPGWIIPASMPNGLRPLNVNAGRILSDLAENNE